MKTLGTYRLQLERDKRIASIAILPGKYVVTISGYAETDLALPALLEQYNDQGAFAMVWAPIWYGVPGRPLVSGVFDQRISGREYVGELVLSLTGTEITISGDSLERKVKKGAAAQAGILAVAHDFFAHTAIRPSDKDPIPEACALEFVTTHVELDQRVAQYTNPTEREDVYRVVHALRRQRYFQPNPLFN